MAVIDSVKLPDNSTYDVADNYSGYAKKAAGATTGDLASLTATGDLADSGKKLSDLVLKADVKDVLNSTSTTDPLSAKQGKVLSENIIALENMYGVKNCIDSLSAVGANATNNDGTFTNTVADSYTYFYMYVQAWDGATFKGNLANAGITQAGEYSYPITIPSGTKTLQIIHNGGTYDIRISFECNVEGDYIISFRVLGADPSTIGSLSFDKVMLRDARVVDDTFVPYAPTNRELMSYKANGKVGAKNLLNMDEYSKPLTHTKAGDSYTFPVLSDIRDRIYQFTDTNMNGIFTVVFSSSGTNVRPAIEIFNSSDTKVAEMITDPVTSSGLSISLPFNNGCKIRVTYFDGGGEPITFTDAMIRIAEDTDETYQPYAMTNRQLTDALDYRGEYIFTGIPYSSSYGHMYASISLPIPKKLRNLYSYTLSDVYLGGAFASELLTIGSGDGISANLESVRLTSTLTNYFASAGAQFNSLSALVSANASITLTVTVQ